MASYNQSQKDFVAENATISEPSFDIHSLGCRVSAQLYGHCAMGEFVSDPKEARELAIKALLATLEAHGVSVPDSEPVEQPEQPEGESIPKPKRLKKAE